MSTRLFDLRMADGSRHFADLSETLGKPEAEWDLLRDAALGLEGATSCSLTTDGVTEGWIEFDYCGARFGINNQHGLWWFFVSDPGCPDQVLLRVHDHFERALSPQAAQARAAGDIATGAHRVLTYEPGSRVATKDFASLSEAQAYADDAASEAENGIVAAYVFDDRFRMVSVGKHY